MPVMCDNGHIISPENPLQEGNRSGRRCRVCKKILQASSVKQAPILTPPTTPEKVDIRLQAPAVNLCQRLLAQCSNDPGGCWTWQGPWIAGPDGQKVILFTNPMIPGWQDKTAQEIVYTVMRGYPRHKTLRTTCLNDLCLNSEHMDQVKS